MPADSPLPTRLLLASVLKPVDDTRMRGKFAEALRAHPGWQVHVAGRATNGAGPSPLTEDGPPVGQHRIFWGSRVGLNRLLAQGRYWQLLRALQPSLVIVHAPELLPLTLLWRALGQGRQFIYDIRENYALNVRTQQVYRGWLKRGLAAGLRWVEGAAATRAAAVLLAEESYAAELPFLKQLSASRVLLLENKYQPAPGEQLPRLAHPLPAPTEPLRLLFSGTISVLNGVWEAIELARHLRTAWPGGAQLTIIGFCQQPVLLADLQQVAATESAWLTLIGGADLVPHSHIVTEIGRSHLGLLPYQPHASTERCRPTKLFEYLAHGLPLFIPHNLLWESELIKYQAGIIVDFADAPGAAAAVAAALPQAHFYPAGVPAEAVLWANEGKKLRVLLESLLSGPTFAAPFA